MKLIVLGMNFKTSLLQLDKKYLQSFIYRNFRPRRVHLYCTGTPKSGTHSITYIFNKRLRSEHEPERDELFSIFFKKRSGNVNKDRLKKLVHKREKRLHLELNSSCFNHIIIEELLELYPGAKFIHPVRSPREWLNSWINHEINHQSCEIHRKFRSYFNVIFKTGKIPYRKEEKILKDLNLPTIEGMLSYWKDHNLKILQTVPEERLLVLRTEDISNKIDTITEFAGLDFFHHQKSDFHAYKAREEHGILSSIDSHFLEKMIDQYSIDLSEWSDTFNNPEPTHSDFSEFRF